MSQFKCYSYLHLSVCVCVCVQSDKHSPVLMALICDELKVAASDILDFELCITDAVPSVCLSSAVVIL